MKPGQSRIFDLTYPDDSSSVHAGKSVRFDIEVKSVERAVDPVWDAALLAKGMEDEAGDRPLTEYEEVFWNRLKFAKANRVFQEELEEAFVALEEVSILEFPKSSVDAQVDSLISQRMQGLEQFGIRNLETYLRYVQQTPEEFRQSLEPEAKASLKQNLLIWDFIEKQKIEIPEDQQERLERQSAEQAALMMNSDVGKRPDVTLEGLQATLLQHSMSETLRHLGRNALLEKFTEGAHSLVRHAEDMPKLNLTPTDEVEGQTAEEVVQDVAEAEPEISHNAA